MMEFAIEILFVVLLMMAAGGGGDVWSFHFIALLVAKAILDELLEVRTAMGTALREKSLLALLRYVTDSSNVMEWLRLSVDVTEGC